MSWLASFEVLPSPNHVLAKLAIFRGAEPSPRSPRATDSASVFYYYFKPFALFFPLATLFHPSRSPVSSPSLPYHLCTGTIRSSALLASLLSDPRSFPSILCLSFTLALVPLATTDVDLPSHQRLVPPGGDENFQTPRDRNRIVISRGSRPARPCSANSLFLPCPWTAVTRGKSSPRPLFFHFPSFFPSLPSHARRRLRTGLGGYCALFQLPPDYGCCFEWKRIMELLLVILRD